MVQKGTGLFGFFKSVYYDEYKWALVKSASLFIVGVRLAQECAGLELMPSAPH
ncbi:uncharacterized protein LOC131282424 [Anopheles ziemanni]|uniref:uncharacterized protein LOC131262560 n=1 Tax=Anopheles coustani TaxID=139045 RepID=UPI00265A08D3|nr:uncharacterized protein LOC131262560 [Anopheles coustani]XP_058167873.1 uncharacterized protein LOC131282424 [Anopheles ziemanni]